MNQNIFVVFEMFVGPTHLTQKKYTKQTLCSKEAESKLLQVARAAFAFASALTHRIMVQPWVIVRRRGTARERRSRRTRAHVRALRVWNHWENYLGGLRLNWENYLSGLRRRRMEMLAACSTQAVEGINSALALSVRSAPSSSLSLCDARVGLRGASRPWSQVND